MKAGEREINKPLFLAVLLLAIFGTMNAVQMLPALLVEIASDLEISVAVAGQLATATFAAWGISVVSVGPLSDSLGRRPVALAGMLLLVGSLVASAFAPNIEVFILMRILTGLGGGALPPNAVGVVADVISPAKRAQAVGALLAVGMLTSAVSVPAVALLAGWGGWRLTFLLSGLLLAAGFVTNLIWFPRDRKERVRNFVFFSRYWSLLAMNFFRVALTVNVTQRVAYWGIVSFFAAFLINTYDVSLGFVALPLAITAIGQVIGSYASGCIATKKYRAALVATTTAAGGVCGFLFFVLDLNIWVAVGLAAMGSGLLSVTFPALVAASTEYSGDSKATGVGLMGLSNQSGGMFGAGLSGALLASTGYEGVGYLCLGLTVVSALLCTLFAKHLRMGGG